MLAVFLIVAFLAFQVKAADEITVDYELTCRNADGTPAWFTYEIKLKEFDPARDDNIDVFVGGSSGHVKGRISGVDTGDGWPDDGLYEYYILVRSDCKITEKGKWEEYQAFVLPKCKVGAGPCFGSISIDLKH